MEELVVPVFLQCFFEFLGTYVMILLGCGVVACTTLKFSKGFGSGWVVITLAWGLAVMCGVFIAGPYTGAHLNPAVTIGLAMAGKFQWGMVVPYIISQMIGAFLGGLTVYYFYKDHFDATEDKDTKLGVFATIPAIKNLKRNLLSEVIGTFVLILVILFLAEDGNVSQVGLGSIGALPVALLVVVIGMALGGHHRLCHKSGARPWTASRACPSPDKGEGWQSMEIRMGADCRTDPWSRLCSACLLAV